MITTESSDDSEFNIYATGNSRTINEHFEQKKKARSSVIRGFDESLINKFLYKKITPKNFDPDCVQKITVTTDNSGFLDSPEMQRLKLATIDRYKLKVRQ